MVVPLIKKFPNLQEAIFLHQRGALCEAEAIYRKLLELEPRNADAMHLLGVIAHQNAHYQTAVGLIAQAIEIRPNAASYYSSQGNSLKKLQQLEAAIKSFDMAIALKPEYAEAFSNRGLTLVELKQFTEAVASFDRAIKLKPDYSEAYTNRGIALKELNRLDYALASFDKAIALKPDLAEAYSNRGLVLQELKQHDAAIASFDKAIALQPNFAEAYSNRGNTLKELKKFEAAIVSYDKAIMLKPDYGEAYYNRGVSYGGLMKLEDALANFNIAFDLNPDLNYLQGMRKYAMKNMCDWIDFSQSITACESAVASQKPVISPFIALNLFDNPELHLLSSKLFVKAKFSKSHILGEITGTKNGGKVRLGYFSADFFYHPVAIWLAELIENHDKSKFELFAFCFRTDIKDPMNARFEAAFDHFIYVDKMSDFEVAKLSRDLRIDVAIDLGGFTKDSRTGIFAALAAPIQVNFLGYPGSMGAEYIHYLIADAHSIPECSQKNYSEKIAYVPCTYTYDRQRQVSEAQMSRGQFGLPENGFVFTCQNGCQKFTPEVFDIWMDILRNVPGSVLWLMEPNSSAMANLKKEAKARGVENERLVFSKRESVEADQERARIGRYLASYRLADLFLDTWPYNAGTTAVDALWSGLPVLTKSGEAMVARMATSALHAIEVPELITSTPQEYKELAIELANDQQKLKRIKVKLQEKKTTSALFDTVGNTRHIEAAYTKMYERYRADLPPEHVYVK
jgi:predicted O-linked N-acetylglucosamine transferase (SPINDLY family)